MKIVKIASLIMAVAFGSLSLQAQTADEIISKHVEAIGGADNWKKVNSLVVTGAMSIQGMSIDMVRTVLHQKGLRQNISMMGMENYSIITPEAGWSFMPIQQKTEVEPMAAEDLKKSQEQLDAQGEFVDYKAKGHSVELVGSETVDGNDCFKIKATFKSGASLVYFIDKKTYYINQTVRTIEDNELVTTFSNYQKTPEGLVFAMSSVLPLAPGMTADYTVSKIEINPTVDPSVFKPSN
jgi:outer membrane lipoprotein-sorting protein